MVVDAMSSQYLAGATVDYEEGLEGSRFVINNPNATSTCGCGSSFSI
jgi:iron-sulfur cluster insertion protein